MAEELERQFIYPASGRTQKKERIMRNEKGFTLIELVVVIVILGILAAVAVPKFVDMQVDARVSSMNGLAGTLRSAASLAHAQWLVKGQPGTIDMEGTTINMASGYPSADASGGNPGIVGAINLDGFSVSAEAANGIRTFTLNGGPAGCSVIYTDAATAASGVAEIDSTNVTDANCQ